MHREGRVSDVAIATPRLQNVLERSRVLYPSTAKHIGASVAIGSKWGQAPVDIAVLVYFRVVFGCVMVWEVMRYLVNAWVAEYYVDPVMHFYYWPFSFVQPLPGLLPWFQSLAMGALACGIVLGWRYRICSVLFALNFTWVFLSEKANYLNHFYLVVLLAWMMVLLPCHRAVSADARRDRSLRSDTTPVWTLWLLRGQLAVVYVYGGIAKLNGDWLQAQPMTIWTQDMNDVPVLGPLLVSRWSPWLLSYGGVFFDLLIVPAVLWRRTRWPALGAALVFHATNEIMFSIGIFPYLAMASMLVFLEPDWPRRAAARVAAWADARRAQALFSDPFLDDPPARPGPRRVARWGPPLAVAWMVWQCGMPLRHWLYDGNVSWHEQGHNFSWHMKLRTKSSRIRIELRDLGTGHNWTVDHTQILAKRQARKMVTRPDMMVQFAHWLAAREGAAGRDIAVYMTVYSSLNGRKAQLLVDPTVDLSKVELGLAPASWILPLTEPLPPNPRPWP
jgi:vitamin K-dependent gamma-carboxylase